MVKWEYLETSNPNLNKIGTEGWELVSVVPENISPTRDPRIIFRYYFKRQVKEETQVLKG